MKSNDSIRKLFTEEQEREIRRIAKEEAKQAGTMLMIILLKILTSDEELANKTLDAYLESVDELSDSMKDKRKEQ